MKRFSRSIYAARGSWLKSLTIKISVKMCIRVGAGQNRRGRRHQDNTLLKLKGPRTEWSDDGGHSGIARFLFDTGTHSLISFDLVDKKGFMCFGSERSCGAHHYPFRQVRLTPRLHQDTCWQIQVVSTSRRRHVSCIVSPVCCWIQRDTSWPWHTVNV